MRPGMALGHRCLWTLRLGPGPETGEAQAASSAPSLRQHGHQEAFLHPRDSLQGSQASPVCSDWTAGALSQRVPPGALPVLPAPQPTAYSCCSWVWTQLLSLGSATSLEDTSQPGCLPSCSPAAPPPPQAPTRQSLALAELVAGPGGGPGSMSSPSAPLPIFQKSFPCGALALSRSPRSRHVPCSVPGKTRTACPHCSAWSTGGWVEWLC